MKESSLSIQMFQTAEIFKYDINLYHGIHPYYGDQMEILHYPRLDTILKVEGVLKKAKGPLAKNEIDRRLATKVMRPTLNLILSYLEESGKVALLEEGVLWIYRADASAKLKAKLRAAVTV
jgi:hypothetical protein